MMRSLLTATIATLIGLHSALGAPSADGSKEGKSPRKIDCAISSVNRLLKGSDKLDKGVVRESGYFKGLHKVAPRISKRDRQPDGSFILAGEIVVSSGPANRFMTIDEHRQIGAAQRALKKAKSDRIQNERIFVQRWERRRWPGSRILLGAVRPGWFRVHGLGHITDAEYDAALIDINRKSDEAVTTAQQELDDLTRPIYERINAQKAKADRVEVQIVVSPDLAKATNWVEFAKTSTPIMFVEVGDYGAAPENEEDGGRLRISTVSLKARKMSNRLTKKSGENKPAQG